MLDHQSRTLFISGFILTVYNFMPCVSCTFYLCTLMTCFFYLPRRFYKFLSWSMIGLGLVASFWMGSALMNYNNKEAKLKFIEYSCNVNQLKFDDNEHRLEYESIGCFWTPVKAARIYVHNQTVKRLVESFGYQNKIVNRQKIGGSTPKGRINSHVVSCQ